MTRISATLAVIGMIFYATSTLASEYVVVGVDNTSAFKQGDIIDGQRLLLLEDGEALTLIDSTGRKIAVKGPITITLDDSTGGGAMPGQAEKNSIDIVQVLARLFFEQPKDTSALGVFRSLDAARIQSSPWMVNVSDPGHHCFEQGRAPVLWRAETSAPGAARIRADGASLDAVVTWSAGASTAPWPVELTLDDDASYRIQVEGDSTARPLVLHRLPDDLPTRMHKAAWMADNNCQRQSVLLVVTADVELLIDALAKEGRF